MKKILFVIAIVLTMTFGASAQTQSDWFVRDFEDIPRDEFGSTILPILITGGVGIWNDDQPATPLGSGLLVLTALGAGYVIRKYRNERK